MSETRDKQFSLEERVANLERDVRENREVLGLLVSYLKLQHDFDVEDFMKWCRFQNRLLVNREAAFSLLHTILEVTEYAETALEAQQDRKPYREHGDP